MLNLTKTDQLFLQHLNNKIELEEIDEYLKKLEQFMTE